MHLTVHTPRCRTLQYFSSPCKMNGFKPKVACAKSMNTSRHEEIKKLKFWSVISYWSPKLWFLQWAAETKEPALTFSYLLKNIPFMQSLHHIFKAACNFSNLSQICLQIVASRIYKINCSKLGHFLATTITNKLGDCAGGTEYRSDGSF